MLAGGAAATRAPEPRGHSRACSQEFPTLITQPQPQAGSREQGEAGFPANQSPLTKKKKRRYNTALVIGWFLRNYFMLWFKRL